MALDRNRNRGNGRTHSETRILLHILLDTSAERERGYACNPHHRHACSAGHLTRSPPRRGQHDVVKGRARFVIALCPDNCGCLTWSY